MLANLSGLGRAEWTFMDHWALLAGFFIPFWLGCFAYAIYFMWHALLPVMRTKFNFYITDFWVGMLCLAPAMALIGEITQRQYAERQRDFCALGIVAASQILGIALARVFSLPRSGEGMPRRIDQAVWVAVGAYLFGLGGLLLIVLAFSVLALAVVMLMSCPGVAVGAAFFVFFVMRIFKRMKRK